MVAGPIGPVGGLRGGRVVDELDDSSVVSSSCSSSVVRVGRGVGENDRVGLVVTVVVIRDGGGCSAVVVTGATAVGGGLVVSTVRAASDGDVCGGGSNGAGRRDTGCVTVGVGSGVVITTGKTAVSSARFNVAMVTPAPMISPTSTVPATARERRRVASG
jgi:hypothetical protein